MVPNFELVRAGVDNFGFLVGASRACPSRSSRAQDPAPFAGPTRALAVAEAVEVTPGEISRGWSRLSAQWSA